MPIADLTGTTWRINEVPVVSQSFQYTIFYTSNNSNYVALVGIPTSQGNYMITYATQSGSSDPDVTAFNTSTGGWNTTGGADYRTIVIAEDQHGQTGVTNPTLIAWLEANAVQVTYPVTISYDGDTVATMSASGTKTLQTAGKYCDGDIEIKYTEPTPSGGTDVSDTTATASDVLTGKYFYTAAGVKTQGTITIYDGTHHSDTHQVTISLSNPVSPSDFVSCGIEELISDHKDGPGNYDDTLPLGEIISPTGSTTVSVHSSSYGIGVFPSGTGSVWYEQSDVSVTGGISYVGTGADVSYTAYRVTGNGTITIDGIDYDD